MNAHRFLALVALMVGSTLAVPGVAAAAPTYPPAPGEDSEVVTPGVVFGGSTEGARIVAISEDTEAVAVTLAPGAPLVLRVGGFDPGAEVDVTAASDEGEAATVGTFTANGNGVAPVGPFKFTVAGTYTVTFSGPEGDTTALGLGSGGNRSSASGALHVTPAVFGIGMRASSTTAAAAGERVVTATVTVSAGAGLADTGGDGLGNLWVGLALLAVGSGFVLVTVRRKRQRV